MKKIAFSLIPSASSGAIGDYAQWISYPSARRGVYAMFKRAFHGVLIAGTVAGALVSFAPQASADCSGFRCNDVSITRLIPWTSNNALYIETSGDESHLYPCQADDNRYIRLPLANPMFSQIHDELFSAFLYKKLVSIRTTESGSCTVVYLWVN